MGAAHVLGLAGVTLMAAPALFGPDGNDISVALLACTRPAGTARGSGGYGLALLGTSLLLLATTLAFTSIAPSGTASHLDRAGKAPSLPA